MGVEGYFLDRLEVWKGEYKLVELVGLMEVRLADLQIVEVVDH